MTELSFDDIPAAEALVLNVWAALQLIHAHQEQEDAEHDRPAGRPRGAGALLDGISGRSGDLRRRFENVLGGGNRLQDDDYIVIRRELLDLCGTGPCEHEA